VVVEILSKSPKPILARTVANQTGVIPAASFQSATPTNHPLLVGKPQARLIKMAKLTTPPEGVTRDLGSRADNGLGPYTSLIRATFMGDLLVNSAASW
jgi:hypothetical protein